MNSNLSNKTAYDMPPTTTSATRRRAIRWRSLCSCGLLALSLPLAVSARAQSVLSSPAGKAKSAKTARAVAARLASRTGAATPILPGAGKAPRLHGPTSEMNSVRALRRRLAQLEAQEARDKKANLDKESDRDKSEPEEREREARRESAKDSHEAGRKKVGEEGENETADWIRARLYYLQQRAYPNDMIDAATLPRALQQRDRMPRATQIGRGTQTERGIGNPPANRNAPPANSKATGFPTSGFSPPGFPPPIIPPGAQWQYFGPHNTPVPYRTYYGQATVVGRINAVLYDPANPGTCYLGAADGGVWKSVDNGATWTPLSDSWQQIHVSSLAIDPTNSQTIYAGTGDYDGYEGAALGIMKSTDGGQTWKNYGNGTLFAVSAILVDPENPQIVTVTTGRLPYINGQVYRSTNGGQTFSPVLQVTAPGAYYTGLEWSSLAVGTKDGNGNRNYYASGQVNGSFVYVSHDRGASWSSITPSQAGHGSSTDFNSNDFNDLARVAASPNDPNTVYILSGYDQKIFKSVNAGTTWTDITNNLPNGSPIYAGYNWSQKGYDLHLECVAGTDSNGKPADVLYAGLIDLAQSPDGGATWRSVGGPTYTNNSLLHNDQHALAPNPANPNELLVGNDGGLFRLTFDGSGNPQYASLNDTLGVTQFYKADFDPNDPTRVLGGAQDNASPVAVGDLNNWLNVAGGDGGGSVINPRKPQIQYATIYNLSVIRTGDGWSTAYPSDTFSSRGQDISPNIGSDVKPFVSTVAIDPTDTTKLYGGTNYLYRYTDAGGVTKTGGSWEARLGSQALAAAPYYVISAIAVAPSDSQRLYTGSQDGQVWMSQDRGATWRRINTGLPTAAITSIAVSPTNPNSILVGLGSSGIKHLWMNVNTTANNITWTSVSGNGASALPDISLNAIALDPDTPQNTWYAGNDVGVFQTLDSGATWQNATAPLGLPNVQVNDLKAVSGTRYLNAATYGRGLWHIRLAPALLSVAVNPASVVGGATVTGTVTYSDPAPAGGVIVALASSNASVASPAASSVTILQGATTATFAINTKAPLNPSSLPVTITATANGVAKTATLTVSNAPTVQLATTATIGTDGNAYQVTVTVTNSGNITANNVVLNTATMKNLQTNALATGTPLPITLGAIAAGTSKSVTVTFPLSIGQANARVLMHFAGRYANGAFAGSLPSEFCPAMAAEATEQRGRRKRRLVVFMPVRCRAESA